EKDPTHGTDIYRIRVTPNLQGIVGFRLEALPSDQLPAHGPGRARDGGFALTSLSVEDSTGEPIELSDVHCTFESPGSSAVAAIQGGTNTNSGWVVQAVGGVPAAIVFATERPIDAGDGTALTFTVRQVRGANAVLGRFRLAATLDPEAVRIPATVVPPREI